MFNASPPVIVLILVALASCVVAWRRSIHESRAWRELVDWLRATHPDVWNAMPRADRFLGRAAIERLESENKVNDPEFRQKLDALHELPSVLPPMLAGAAAIAGLLLGSHVFGWRW